MEQRHPVFHTRMAPPVGDRQIQRVLRRVLSEQVAPSRAEPRGRLLVQRHFRHRPQRERLALARAALGRGIEHPDRLDGIAEQVQPHRIRFAGREDVDDPATHRIFARLHHRAGTPISVCFQEFCQLLRLHVAVDRQLHAGAGKRRAGRHALHQRIHRRQHDPWPGRLFQQPGQRRDPLRHQSRIRRHTVVWQTIPRRKAEHLRLRHHECQCLCQPGHPRVIAGRMQHAACVFAPPLGQQECIPAFRRTPDLDGIAHRAR
jgi:hypothetical protein